MINRNRRKSPVQTVDELQAWLSQKIGIIAEDDWLLLDDFEGYCDSVRREWHRASHVSIANPDVKKEMLARCATNMRLAEAAFAIVAAWLERR